MSLTIEQLQMIKNFYKNRSCAKCNSPIDVFYINKGIKPGDGAFFRCNEHVKFSPDHQRVANTYYKLSVKEMFVFKL